MKINQAEQIIGITKKNIRFYEQEGLLTPSRSTNGYRDYTDEDINTLRQIKLLRKLDLPIEEIKLLQNGSLTLRDGLRRHLIVLERKSQNLEAIQAFCHKLLEDNSDLQSLDAAQLLQEMDALEKGGTKFVNIQRKDNRKRKQGAIIGALTAIVFMALFAGLMIFAAIEEPEIPVLLVIMLIAVPLLGIVGTGIALRERLREIEGGELDEASKY